MKQKTSVLIIDDEIGIREMLSYELSQSGYETTTAEDGITALEIIKQHKFDLAITDLKMPGMSGEETVAALKNVDPDLEIIVATGYATVETAVQCMKNGAYDYIQKPFNLSELQILLEKAMEKSHLHGVVALYEASRALLSTLKYPDLIHLIANTAIRIMRATASGLILKQKEGADYGFYKQAEHHTPSDALLRKLIEQSGDKRIPLLVPSPENQDIGKDLLAEHFISAIIYPLATGERTIGSLVLLRNEGQPLFTVSEMQRGTVFATQITLAMDNANLYGELEKKMQELTSAQDQLVQTEKMALAGRLAEAVSHEINNPLTYVRANLHMLRDYSTSVGSLWLSSKQAAEYLLAQNEATAQKFARGILDSGGSEKQTAALIQEIAEVINDTLDGVQRIADLVHGFSSISRPQTDTKTEIVDLGNLVVEYAEEFQSSPIATNRKIIYDVEDNIRVNISRDDLKTALSNVLFFLCKHSHRHSQDEMPSITIRVRSNGKGPCITLADPTLELSQEEQIRIFDPRIDVESKGRTMRLDIGLTLAYQLFQRNGGNISIVPNTIGGIIFSVVFKSMATQGE